MLSQLVRAIGVSLIAASATHAQLVLVNGQGYTSGLAFVHPARLFAGYLASEPLLPPVSSTPPRLRLSSTCRAICPSLWTSPGTVGFLPRRTLRVLPTRRPTARSSFTSSARARARMFRSLEWGLAFSPGCVSVRPQEKEGRDGRGGIDLRLLFLRPLLLVRGRS